MSDANRLHSFTISPKASHIISTIRNKKKSLFVTNAIIHYREWQHKEHLDFTDKELIGVKDMKDINLHLEEKQLLLERWVQRSNQNQDALIILQEKYDRLLTKKWYQFWK